MNCRKAETLITTGVYGRLTPEERTELEIHAGTCPACTALFEKWAGIIELRVQAREDDAPLPDWEKSWSRIAAEALDKRPRRRLVFGRPELGWPVWARRATAAAAVLFVFVLGYFAGRRVLFDRSGEGVRTAAPSPAVGGSLLAGFDEIRLAEYADNLRPLLVDFLNRGNVRPPDDLVALKRRIVRDMLGQTRLLKRLAAESGDAAQDDLLSDLEFILTSMANLAPGDTESAVHLERMIRAKDIALRLRELASPATI